MTATVRSPLTKLPAITAQSAGSPISWSSTRWGNAAFNFAGESGGVLALNSVTSLADEIAQAQRVVALVAASDVTLLSAKTPPLSPAKSDKGRMPCPIALPCDAMANGQGEASQLFAWSATALDGTRM